MIRLLNILVSGMDIPDEPFAKVRGICPEAVSGPIFKARLPDSDPRTVRILEVLRSYGIKELGDFDSPEKNSFRVRPNYVYEESDLEAASYFTFISSISLRSVFQESIDQVLQVYAPNQRKKLAIAECGIYSGTIVSNDTMKTMKDRDFRGLTFLETEFIDKKNNPIKTSKVFNAPFWQIRSAIVLPELHPKCLKLDQDGEEL